MHVINLNPTKISFVKESNFLFNKTRNNLNFINNRNKIIPPICPHRNFYPNQKSL